MFDEDIKIAGADAGNKKGGRDSDSAMQEESEYRRQLACGNIALARDAGSKIAVQTINAAGLSWSDEKDDSFEIQLQRGLLLAFSAVATIESASLPSVLEDVMRRSFFDDLRNIDSAMYKETAESGAFSFYYLAYRRGTDLERRVGQTFAMLCSHDGDPIYQELGETLFCWMRSKTESILKSISFFPV